MDILIVKTFGVVVMMLCATALAARRNYAFEAKWEFWGLFITAIVLIFVIPVVAMPINIILALGLAWIMGAIIGPELKGMMQSYVVRKRLEAMGYDKAKQKAMSEEEYDTVVAPILADLSGAGSHSVVQDWNNLVGLALYGTAGMTLLTAVAVMMLDIDFSFLGWGLFVALLGLVVIGLLNILFFKNPLVRLIGSYIGAVVFSLFLLYDFNQLEKAVATGDTSWNTAINVGISIYLDIINLFMDLLDILSSN